MFRSPKVQPTQPRRLPHRQPKTSRRNLDQCALVLCWTRYYPRQWIVQKRKTTTNMRCTMERQLMDMASAAAMLRVSKRTCRRLIDRRLIAYYKVSGSIRFDKRDIDRYLCTVYQPVIFPPRRKHGEIMIDEASFLRTRGLKHIEQHQC